MADGAGATEPIHIMGAGLSGLAAATILAKAGKDVHVHDVRADSGARFDGDFQALENWSMDADFFQQLEQWGFDASQFRATEFQVFDLIHPDDVITQPLLKLPENCCTGFCECTAKCQISRAGGGGSAPPHPPKVGCLPAASGA